MGAEQYVGCIVIWNGRPAEIAGFRSSYDGEMFSLKYTDEDGSSCFEVNAFDKDMLKALPDPDFGILKKKDGNAVFLYRDTEYVLGDHPYEPCLYIKKDGSIFRTLHYAFTLDGIFETFSEGRSLLGIDGKEYDMSRLCRVLASAIDGSRSETDFPYAAKQLAKDSPPPVSNTKTVNITSGECLNKILEEKHKGMVFIPFNEAMNKGSYTAPLFTEKFIGQRAKVHGVSEEEYRKKLSGFLDILEEPDRYEEITLWFGSEPFCSANKAAVLRALKQYGFSGRVTVNTVDEKTGDIISSKTV